MNWIDSFVDELHQIPNEWFLSHNFKWEVRSYKGAHVCYCETLKQALKFLKPGYWIKKI